MATTLSLLVIWVSLAASVSGFRFDSTPFKTALSKRQDHYANASGLIVDLGYEIYEGVEDVSSGIRSFLGYIPPTFFERVKAE